MCSWLIASSKVAHFQQTFSPFLPSTPVLFPQPTILGLRQCQRLLNGSPYGYLCETRYNIQRVVFPFSTSALHALLMATVIKHDCVDQCRACGSQIYSQWGRSRSPIMLSIVLVCGPCRLPLCLSLNRKQNVYQQHGHITCIILSSSSVIYMYTSK